MAGFSWKRDRISEVVSRYRDLEKAFQSAVRRLGPNYQTVAIRTLLGEWRRHLTELGSTIRGLAQQRTTHGQLTAGSASDLRDPFAALSRSAREFDERVVIGKGRRPSETPAFRELIIASGDREARRAGRVCSHRRKFRVCSCAAGGGEPALCGS